MELTVILALIQGVIAAAPKVIEIGGEIKDFISALASHGVITDAQQDALHAHVDAVCDARLRGEVPPSFQVEADPVDAPPTAPAQTATPPPQS